MTEAYIYDAVRTPRGKGRKDGSLHEVTSVRLSSQILNAVKERNNLEGHAVEDVIWGDDSSLQFRATLILPTCPLARPAAEPPRAAAPRRAAAGRRDHWRRPRRLGRRCPPRRSPHTS